MAELAASMVVAPLVSLLKEKVSSSLLGQYKVMEGMEKQHKILERKLPAILDILADAEKQASHRGGVKKWLEALKATAYEANEVFDDFEYEALRRRAKENGHITKLGIIAGVKLFPTHNHVAFRIRMGHRLRRIVDTFKDLEDEMKTFEFKKQLEVKATPVLEEWRETASTINDSEKIVGRDEEKKRIVDILVNGHVTGGDLMVVPIVGMGGLGKTTLAQLIYNDPQVQEHFQLLKWVCVSDDFNVRDLANKICCSSETTLEEALNKLKGYLRGKRYLLVLDDVWNEDEDEWGKLKACLKQGGAGSAVLTTTRNKKIAEFMAQNSWENKHHDMEKLDIVFIKDIIATRAFRLSKTNNKPELVELVGRVAKRCAGSPLAAKALGSVLCNKTTKEEWEDILDQTSICNDQNGILRVLKLSYNDLPTVMTQCFAFCAMYPKDYQIDVDELIQLWMANGYISDQNNVPAETMGKQIVSEMVSRSFFQYYEEQGRVGYSSTTFVKIHDLMHDVALSASEECVCITERGESLPSAARHILFQTSIGKHRFNSLFGAMREVFPPIQTMMCNGFFYGEDVLHLSKFSSLRALSMRRSGLHLSIKPKHLCHLRYLDLSDSEYIEALPDDISILYSLQTLKLSGCKRLRRLPQQMKYMSALRHLYTDGCNKLECMPPVLGQLTSLQRITWFVVGSGSNCSSLGELKNLNIGGSLMLKQLENVKGGRDAKAANLENKKEMRQLSLQWTSGNEEEQPCHEVLENLKAHDGLLALEICSYQGTGFPSWMGTLKNIVELRLSGCSKAEQLPPLCQLVELQLLHLEGLEKLQFLCSSCTSSTFGKLKDLKLVNLQVLEGFCEAMHGAVVAFPQLETAVLKKCPKLTTLPRAPMLKKLILSEANKQFSLGGISLFLEGVNLDVKEEWDHPSSAFCYGKLQDLTIDSCDELVHWPEKVFQSLNSLRRLQIKNCKNLTGYAASNGPNQATIGRSQLLPHLESLEIYRCDSLVEVFNSPALKRMQVCYCHKLESLYGKQQLNEDAASTHDVMASAHVQEKLSPSIPSGNLLPSSLEYLTIWDCDGLSEIVYLPSSLRGIEIKFCDKLRSISGQLDTLKELEITYCKELRSLESLCIKDLSALESLWLQGLSLASFPSWPEPQEYSSLRDLTIVDCPGIKLLPPALQRRLDSGLMEYTSLDSHLKDPSTVASPTAAAPTAARRRLLGRLCCSH